MSTLTEIQSLIKGGKLREYAPMDVQKDFQFKRNLFVTEEVYMACPPSDRVSGSKKSLLMPAEARYAARQIMRSFIGGDPMTENAQIKLLNPHQDQVWELKAVPQSRHNQARIFGWFADYDCYIATHIVMRSELKNAASGVWAEEIAKCKDKRTRICGSLPIYSKITNVQDYLSNSRAEIGG